MYQPSVKSAIIIARLSCAVVIGLIGLWHFTPAFHTHGWTLGIFGTAIVTGLMAAWHEGYATPVKEEQEERQSGNALILILIAVALFAALTAVMNQGSRSSTGMMTDQQAKLAAIELMDIFRTRADAYKMLQLRGCSSDEIHMGVSPYGNGQALTPLSDERCHIESPQGAGFSAPQFPDSLQPDIPQAHIAQKSAILYNGPYVKAHTPTQSTYVIGLGENDAPDYMITINFIRTEICKAYNALLGIDGIPRDDGYIFGDEATILRGKITACRDILIAGTSTTIYQIHYVYEVN